MAILKKWQKPGTDEVRIYVNGGNRKVYFTRAETGKLTMVDPDGWQKSKNSKYSRGEKDNAFAYEVLREHGIIDETCNDCWTAEAADRLFAAVA